MSVTIADITQRVEDRYSYETVEATRLTRTITSAMRWYNRHAPRVRIGSLTTVADQENYALPSDCPRDGVVEVYWFPGIDFSGYTDLYQQWADAEVWEFRNPSERIIAAINRGYARDFQRGSHDIREGELVLIPTPATAGTVVYFEYAGNHELNIDETAYETVPAEHLEVIALLTVAELLLDQSFNNLPRPDYSTGYERFKRSHIPRNIRDEVKYMRGQAKAELSRAVAVETS